MSIRSTNTTRNIEARKSSLPTIGRGVPHNSQGNEGDLTFRRTSDGLMLYIKANHSWHGVKVGESFSSLESTIKDIKSKVDLMKQFRLPSTYSVKGSFTLDASDIRLDSGNGRFYFYNNGDTDDYMRLNVNASGSVLITTYDSDGAEGHYSILPDGKIKLGALDGAADSIQCNVGGNTFASFAAEDGSYSRLTMYEQGGSSPDDYMALNVQEDGATSLMTTDAGGQAAHFTLNPDGDIILKAGTGGTFIKEIASATTDRGSYGQIWVKSDTPNNLYFTDDTGQDVQITNNGSLAASGGTPRFHFVTGGYITNKTSTTTYYFQYRPLGESWNNAEASPTSINAYDLSAALWIAPAAGKITNITVQGYTNDTGATDPFKFYIFSGTPTHNATSTTLSSFLTTSAITGSAARNLRYSEDFTSSNTFSAGDTFYVMWKKDSNTGSQDFYFSITISGEYT